MFRGTNQEKNTGKQIEYFLINVEAKGVIYVNKLLAFAAENSFSSVKALSAKFSADQVNTKDQRGNTALYYAAKNQNMEFMNYLLNLGADPSVVC